MDILKGHKTKYSYFQGLYWTDLVMLEENVFPIGTLKFSCDIEINKTIGNI